jgi:hypothetical protein
VKLHALDAAPRGAGRGRIRASSVRIRARPIRGHGRDRGGAPCVAMRGNSRPRVIAIGRTTCFALHAAHRNDGIATPNFALGIDAGVVIALVHRHCLGLETTSVQRVEQRRNKQRFMVTCGARLPRERESRPGADREVDLVPVEAAALAGADCAAVSPRCVRVGELLAEFASVARPRRWSKDRDCGETSRIVAELDALE